MTAYAVLADLYAYGMPLVAMGSVSVPTQQMILDARNSYADSKFRARYKLPFVSFDVSVTQHVCMLAAYDCMLARGYNPGAGADVNIATRAEMAFKWFDDVERQRAHPNVVELTGADVPAYGAPLVLSSPLQGWNCNSSNRGGCGGNNGC